MFKVVPISFEQIPRELIAAGKKARVTFENPKGAHWLAVFDGDDMVAVSCCVIPPNGKTARFKSSYTKEAYRGKGLFAKLLQHSIALCRQYKIQIATVFSTPFSLNSHLQHGGQPVSRRGDITFIRYLF